MKQGERDAKRQLHRANGIFPDRATRKISAITSRRKTPGEEGFEKGAPLGARRFLKSLRCAFGQAK